MSTPAMSAEIDELRRAWKDAAMAPLWENKFAHRPPPLPEASYLWSWQQIRPLISGAIKVASPEAIERRVLQLIPPGADEHEWRQTTKTICANLQVLLPGEKARPHRHSMNALRFVLEGSGATTIVDGKPCRMDEGDLVLTPAWTWHEHVHEGTVPIIWLDVLDVPMHHYLGTGAFQPGPVGEPPETVAGRGLRGRRASCPTWRTRPSRIHRSSVIPMGRPLRPFRSRRLRAMVRAVCVTSIRSTAAPRWNSSTASWSNSTQA